MQRKSKLHTKLYTERKQSRVREWELYCDLVDARLKKLGFSKAKPSGVRKNGMILSELCTYYIDGNRGLVQILRRYFPEKDSGISLNNYFLLDPNKIRFSRVLIELESLRLSKGYTLRNDD